MQDKDLDFEALLDEMDEVSLTPERKEYLVIQKVFKEMFGHIPERLLMPPIITEEQIKDAMLECIEIGEDHLGELLNLGKDYRTNIDKNKFF